VGESLCCLRLLVLDDVLVGPDPAYQSCYKHTLPRIPTLSLSRILTHVHIRYHIPGPNNGLLLALRAASEDDVRECVLWNCNEDGTAEGLLLLLLLLLAALCTEGPSTDTDLLCCLRKEEEEDWFVSAGLMVGGGNGGMMRFKFRKRSWFREEEEEVLEGVTGSGGIKGWCDARASTTDIDLLFLCCL